MTVAFDAEKHAYAVDGVQVPSVTSLVSPLGADYDEPDDAMEMVLDAATDRGTTMHAYIEHRLCGGEREDFELPSIYETYADSVETFISDHEIVPMLIEQPLPGHGYAGTPDLVCEFDGELAIVDYKFVSQIAKSKVAAQLCGYMELCETSEIYPEKLYAVQFMRDGKYRLYSVSIPFGRNAFEKCLELYKIKNEKHPRGKIGKE